VTVAAVVFDLGGVLAELTGVDRMCELAALSGPDEMWQRWLTCEHVRAFERGQCTVDEFATGVVTSWGVPLEPAAFLAEFGTWLKAPYDGATELVTAVKEQVPVGLLSNTNAVHWEVALSSWPLTSLFDHVFLSFRLGLVKPDAAVFTHVVDAIGAAPADLVFLDDNDLNVDAAHAAGLSAHRVRGVAAARAALTSLGLLS
jgi:HAD superfamily hydrolase (TIGR01509 family)